MKCSWFRRRRRPRQTWEVTDTGGREARKQAEKALAQSKAELARVREETEKYAALGREASHHRRENHLAQLFIGMAGGKR